MRMDRAGTVDMDREDASLTLGMIASRKRVDPCSRRMPQKRARDIARVLRKVIRAYEEPAVGVVAKETEDPFRVLIATVLSPRTKDTVTGAAARRLFRRARTPRGMLRLSRKAIARVIFPVGMSPTKAKHVRAISRILLARHGGHVPRTRTELEALPGVGRKVANLVLGLAFGEPAICVDTHVHRISNRLGLVRTRRVDETERALEQVLPRHLWIDWNELLVTWGQNVCVPISPRCSRCVLNHRKLCPRVGVTQSR